MNVIKRASLKLAVVASMVVFLFASAVSLAEEKPELTEIEKSVVKIADAYVQVQMLLADDEIEGISEKTSEISVAASAISSEINKDENPDGNLLRNLAMISETAGKFNADDLTIESAREYFYTLSENVIQLVETSLSDEAAADYPVFYCPMAKGYWIGAGEDVRNPYYGSEMLKCGKMINFKEECKAAHENCKCPDKDDPAHTCGCFYRSKSHVMNGHGGCAGHKASMNDGHKMNKLEDD